MPIFGKQQVNKSLDLVDQLVTDQDKKNEIIHDLIESDNTSGSSYTRNARPSIIYFGLIVMFLEMFGFRYFCLLNMDASEVIIKQSTAMLEYFILTWGGLVSIYQVGRSYEKKKIRFLNKSKG